MCEGICAGDRASLARGITLIESTQPARAVQARLLVTALAAHCRNTGQNTFRLGLSGPPGAGKAIVKYHLINCDRN